MQKICDLSVLNYWPLKSKCLADSVNLNLQRVFFPTATS